jgi:hypothetical protein
LQCHGATFYFGVMATKTKESYLPLEPMALILGVPKRYLKRLATDGYLPHLVIGGRLRFEPAQTAAILRQLAETNAPNRPLPEADNE